MDTTLEDLISDGTNVKIDTSAGSSSSNTKINIEQPNVKQRKITSMLYRTKEK